VVVSSTTAPVVTSGVVFDATGEVVLPVADVVDDLVHLLSSAHLISFPTQAHSKQSPSYQLAPEMYILPLTSLQKASTAAVVVSVAPAVELVEIGPVVDGKPVVEATGSVVEAIGPVVESIGPVVDTIGPVVEAIGPVVEAIGPVVEAIGPVVEAIGPVVDAIGPVVEAIGPVVDAIGPVVEGTPGVVVTTPVVETATVVTS